MAQAYLNDANYQEISVPACMYVDGEERDVKVLVHRKKESSYSKGNPSPAMVYFHGGGAVAMSASTPFYIAMMTRYAEDNDIVVFSVDYRLAPEAPAPGGIMDCYAALKYVLDSCDEFNIDKTKVCIGGESGGGYLAMGVGLHLARNGESD